MRIRSIDRSLDRSVDHSIARSLDRSIAPLIARSIGQSLASKIPPLLWAIYDHIWINYDSIKAIHGHAIYNIWTTYEHERPAIGERAVGALRQRGCVPTWRMPRCALWPVLEYSQGVGKRVLIESQRRQQLRQYTKRPHAMLEVNSEACATDICKKCFTADAVQNVSNIEMTTAPQDDSLRIAKMEAWRHHNDFNSDSIITNSNQ